MREKLTETSSRSLKGSETGPKELEEERVRLQREIDKLNEDLRSTSEEKRVLQSELEEARESKSTLQSEVQKLRASVCTFFYWISFF